MEKFDLFITYLINFYSCVLIISITEDSLAIELI